MIGILRQVQGWIKVKGASTGTFIGNIVDNLKTTSLIRGGTDETNIGNYKDRLFVDGRITNLEGKEVGITNFGELKTVSKHIDAEVRFQYVIDTLTILRDHANGGSASAINSQAVLSTSTATNGRAFLRTKRASDYRTSQEIEFSSLFRVPGVTGAVGTQLGPSDCKVVTGAMNEDENNFIRWGFENGSRFFVEWAFNGTPTRILATSFNRDALDGVSTVNGEVSEYAPDFTKLQLIRATYSWHGITPITFQILKPSGEWRTFHVETFINDNTLASTAHPFLPVAALIENNGSTVDNTLVWQAAQTSLYGTRNLTKSPLFFEVRNEGSFGDQSPVLSIRNKDTYQSLKNVVDAVIDWISLSSDGNRFASFTFYLNATLTGASFIDVDTVNSTFEYDISATSFTNGRNIFTVSVGQDGQFNGLMNELELFIYPSDTITIAANTGGTTDLTASIHWKERH